MFIKLFALSNLILLSSAMNINIINNCPWLIDIYSHEVINGKPQFTNKCKIQNKKSCLLKFSDNKVESGLIKNLDDEKATLFEFTKNKDGIWYDISVIPPGSGNCNSYDECYQKSKKTGFNDPLRVGIKTLKKNSRCVNLKCLDKKCPDAYLYPYDDTKTHFCHLNTNFTLTYC
jgi:hypothetical protein